MDNDNFKFILKNTYIKDPCKVLPAALWKTLRRLDQLDCYIEQTGNGESILQAWDQSGLHIFWSKSREMDH